MTEEQFNQLSELIKIQNDMIGRLGLILVRGTWLMVAMVILLVLILAWII